MNEFINIKILGAGPTGSLLAIALANIGVNVCIYDPADIQEIISRSRAYAITHSSYQLLYKLDLWHLIREKANSFSKLILLDNQISQSIQFTCSDLPVELSCTNSIGWIVDHEHLMEVLFTRISKEPNIQFNRSHIINPDMEHYDLVVAADGHSSPARKSWKIPLLSIPYNQGCLTAKVLLRGTNSSTAYEIFRKEGPFAILPMGGDVYQIIWSDNYHKNKDREELSTSSFLDQLATVLPYGIEPDSLIDIPRVFPLRLSIASKLSKGNKLLIGESAHRCHPVGGQGLNLCWRDINELLHLIKKIKKRKLKISRLPFYYSIKRYPDIISVGLLTHLLILLFSSDNIISKIIRNVLIRFLSSFHVLRIKALQAMTKTPMTFFNFMS